MSGRGTSGSAFSRRATSMISRSLSPSTFWCTRPMRIASSCPLVVRRPTFAPVREMSALTAAVVPWAKTCVCASSARGVRPSSAAALATDWRTPTVRSLGVVSALSWVTVPSAAMTTQSVKVPPVSTPMM